MSKLGRPSQVLLIGKSYATLTNPQQMEMLRLFAMDTFQLTTLLWTINAKMTYDHDLQ